MNTAVSPNSTRPTSYEAGQYQHRSVTRANIDVETRAGITLVTADGDKVTLSAHTSTRARLKTYNYFGQIHGQTIAAQGKEFHLASRSAISLSVEGSLDEDELQDIKQLLDTLSSVGKDFFSGKGLDGLQRVAQLGGLDEIASFEADFSYSRQASAQSVSQVSIPTPALISDSAENAPLDSLASNVLTEETLLDQLAEATDSPPQEDQVLVPTPDQPSDSTENVPEDSLASGTQAEEPILDQFAQATESVPQEEQISIPPQEQASDSAENPLVVSLASSDPVADLFLDQLAQAVENFPRENSEEKIPKRFGHLINKLAHHLPLDDDDRRLADRIRSEHAHRGHGHHHGVRRAEQAD